ncbi:exo-alpha-sialidase [Pseudochryseolinea flava]|uniref:exo-alpha-sialidase n=1 Tax=Pseudochryseolinea flava TaxID=2059302 RepID=UPI0014025A1F|nr:exo-alpha-sialidase [Pseudochryseolinea flava]
MNRRYLIALFFAPMLFIACKDGESQEDPKPITLATETPVDGVRIAWDRRTLKKLSPSSSGYSGYARMIVLDDASLFCVFENDGKIQKTTSSDGGVTWSTPVTIAVGDDGIAATVPEILLLADKSLLLSYNMRPHGTPVPSKRFGIRVSRSTNGGVDWSAPKTVYEAGHEFANGCWEPAQIQLPSGEIQLFIANEGPYTSSNEQEITMFRSNDNGDTWNVGEKVSFRAGHRDGMPVPLILNNRNEIILSIEDNGIIPTEFKPMIIRTSLQDSWKNAPVLASSVSREQPMDKLNRMVGAKYGGAPFIRQLKSNEVVLSYQSNEFRKDNIWDRSDMVVCIGDDSGKNFNRKSRPFYFTDNTRSCMWNSLCVADDKTIWAIGSTNAFGNKSEVWIIKGIVLPNMVARKQSLAVDGESEEDLWTKSPQAFIGGFGNTRLMLNTSYDDQMLYFTVKIEDENVKGGTNISLVDGFRLYIDPMNKGSIGPDQGIFSLAVTASGVVSFQQGAAATWKEEESSGIVVKNKNVTGGYQSEIGIPWSKLGGKVSLDKRIGFHACLYESVTGSQHVYEEPLQGNVNNAAYSWSTLILK